MGTVISGYSPSGNTYLLAQKNLDVHLDQKAQVALRILFPQEILEHHQDLGSLSYQQGLVDLHPQPSLWLQEVLKQYKKELNRLCHTNTRTICGQLPKLFKHSIVFNMTNGPYGTCSLLEGIKLRVAKALVI